MFVGGVMVIVSTGIGQQGAVVVQIAVSSPHLPDLWNILLNSSISTEYSGLSYRSKWTSLYFYSSTGKIFFFVVIYILKLSVKRKHEIIAIIC